MIAAAFRRVVLSRRWLSFAVLCAGFAVFGVCTLNLFVLLRANVGLIAEHGLMALFDGAAQQLVEIVLTLLVGMAAYVIFKACEHNLVHGLTHGLTETPDEDNPS